MRIWFPFVLGTLLACGGDADAPADASPAASTDTPDAADEPAVAEADEPAEDADDAEADGAADDDADAQEADFASMSEDEQEAWLMAKGEEVYTTGGSGMACVTCHQADGTGMDGAFPALAGAEDALGSCEDQAQLIIQGRDAMPAQPGLSDEEIAGVITYTRNAWGNDMGLCTPDQVQALR